MQKTRKNSIFCEIFVVIMAILLFLVFFNADEINLYFEGFGKIFSSPFQVYFFDVGQASASMIVLPNGDTIVIDTGGQATSEIFVEYVELVLSKSNCKDIDILILTHPDEDHIGGAKALLERFSVGLILRPKVASTSKYDKNLPLSATPVTTSVYKETVDAMYDTKQGQVMFVEDAKLAFDEVYMQIFACNKDDYGSETNSYSPFVAISYKSQDFLFTGDAGFDRETEFLQDLKTDERYKDEKFEFLQVAHHGSKYSTSEEFLSVIQPKFAFISALDDYHPSGETLARLKEASVETFCTKEDNMIAVGINDEILFCTDVPVIDLPFVVTAGYVLLFMFAFFTHSFENFVGNFKRNSLLFFNKFQAKIKGR